MFETLQRVLDDIRDNPREFVGDLIGAVCLAIIFWGLMFLPIILE